MIYYILLLYKSYYIDIIINTIVTFELSSYIPFITPNVYINRYIANSINYIWRYSLFR